MGVYRHNYYVNGNESHPHSSPLRLPTFPVDTQTLNRLRVETLRLYRIGEEWDWKSSFRPKSQFPYSRPYLLGHKLIHSIKCTSLTDHVQFMRHSRSSRLSMVKVVGVVILTSERRVSLHPEGHARGYTVRVVLTLPTVGREYLSLLLE